MTWDMDLEDLMTQTVTIEPISSVDEYNKPTFGASVTYVARVVEVLKRVVDFKGVEQVATTEIWIAPPSTGIPDITPGARVTLPDGTTPPLLAFEVYPDETGAEFAKIFMGASQ